MVKAEIAGIPAQFISTDSVGHNFQIGEILILRVHATGRYHFIVNGEIHHDVTEFMIPNILGGTK